MTPNHHSPERLLIELRIEHADLDERIDRQVPPPTDDLVLRRMKKRRLVLRDQIAALETRLQPQEPA